MLLDIVYVLIALVVAQRLFTAAMRWVDEEFGIESEDIIVAAIISIALSIFWPVVVVVYGIYRLALKPIVDTIKKESK